MLNLFTHKKLLSSSVLVICALLLLPISLFAAEVTLSWNAPTTNADQTPLTDLSGYVVYYGKASGNYTESIDVGNVTSYHITDLQDSTTYFFTVTAYDTSGNESNFAEEKSKVTSMASPPPSQSGIEVISLTATSARISWTTNVASTAQIEYGTTTEYGSLSSNTESLSLNHAVTISNLQPETQYHYRVRNTDINSNLTISTDFTFTTTATVITMKVGHVLLYEDFSEGIPSNWTSEGAWDSDNSCNRTIEAPFSGDFAIVDSACSNTGSEELITKQLDTTSCSSLDLIYSNQYYWYSGQIEVETSSDNGSTWMTDSVVSSDDGYPLPNTKSLDISSILDTEEGRIKFKYANSNTNGFWAIDDIQVNCQSDDLAITGLIHLPATETIVITNSNSENLTINSLALEGANTTSFSIERNNSCDQATLLPDESCMFDITYIPDSVNIRETNLIISSDDPVSPVKIITLTGRGAESNTGSILGNPVPDITANGSDDTIQLLKGDRLEVAITLDSGNYSGQNSDMWVLFKYRNRLYYYDVTGTKWRRGFSLYDQPALSDFGPVTVLDSSSFPKGLYTFYFIVDTNMNGVQDTDMLYYDAVTVNIK